MELQGKKRYIPPALRQLNQTEPSKFQRFLSRRDKIDAESSWGSRDYRDGKIDYNQIEEEEQLFTEILPSDEGINAIEFNITELSENIPEMTEFEACDVHKTLLGNVKRMRYELPTPIQRYSIPVLLLRRDLMGCAQTGSGKTAAYLFPTFAKMLDDEPPAAQRERQARPVSLILVPTRELSIQICNDARKFSHKTGIRSVVVYGGADAKIQARELDKGADLLVATPGRLLDFMKRGRISLRSVRYLIMDEADRMLDMGFEPQIREIVESISADRETAMFSATFPKAIKHLAENFLNDYVFLSIGRVGSTTENITQELHFVEEHDKRSYLLDFLTGTSGLVLVFVETKRTVDYLNEFLYNQNFKCTAIHGDRSQNEREKALSDFKSAKKTILVATDVAARGLDIPNVTTVINFDLPNNIEDYVHRIGRTGRAGKQGLAISFINEKNKPIVKDLYGMMCETKQNIENWFESMYRQQISYGSRGRRGRRGYRNTNW